MNASLPHLLRAISPLLRPPAMHPSNLLRRTLERVRHLRLPAQTILAEDLSRDGEFLAAL